MNIRVTRATAAVALSAVLLILVPQVRAGEKEHCSTLLTAAEVKSVLGQELSEVSEPVSLGPGHSQCSFFAGSGDDLKIVTLSFSDIDAVRDFPTPMESVTEFYDMNVSSAQDVTGEKGEKLPGLGLRAILFKATVPFRIYVETKTGFADIATSGLTPDQLKAVAKAAVAR